MSKIPGSSVASLVNLVDGFFDSAVKHCSKAGTIASVVTEMTWVGDHNITKDGQIQLVVAAGENIPTEVVKADARGGFMRSRKGGGTGRLTINVHIEVETDRGEDDAI